MALNASNEYEVVLTKQAKNFLSSVPKNFYRLLSNHLLALKLDPFPHGAIKLKGSENKYRLRVGSYRILYIVEHGVLVITIIKIGNRKDVYD